MWPGEGIWEGLKKIGQGIVQAFNTAFSKDTYQQAGKGLKQAYGFSLSKPTVGIITTTDEGETSNTDHLSPPRETTIDVDMDVVENTSRGLGQKRLKRGKASKTRAGRTGGTDVKDVANGQNGDGDIASLEAFKDQANSLRDSLEESGFEPGPVHYTVDDTIGDRKPADTTGVTIWGRGQKKVEKKMKKKQ
jgi:hypothetical protein